MGDLLFLIHDWLFTEQFVSAALFLPILLDGFELSTSLSTTTISDKTSQSSVSIQRERVARRQLYAAMGIQYSAIAIWTALSLAIGTFIIRMSLWVVQTVQTIIFSIALWRLRKLMAKVNSSAGGTETDVTVSFTSNVALMNWN